MGLRFNESLYREASFNRSRAKQLVPENGGDWRVSGIMRGPFFIPKDLFFFKKKRDGRALEIGYA